MVAQSRDFTTISENAQDLIRSRLCPLAEELGCCRSTTEVEAHPVYARLRPVIEQVLQTPQFGEFGPSTASRRTSYRILAWNIERGTQLAGQLEAFRAHPYLSTCDVLLLTETDSGMARSGNVDVAQTLARELGFHYAFVPCYLSLVKGSGVEREVDGTNDLGLHGNAILSRYPIRDLVRIPLRNGIDKMAAREKRLGSQVALAATINFPDASLTVVCAHLDANSTQRHRAAQMRDILDALPPDGPALIGGDWNTTTFDSSSAFRSIMGYARRVLMGPGRVIRNHYLHPDRWFERHLFGLLQERGFDYRACNRSGEYTIYYDVEDIRTYKSLAEWMPNWCFAFIRWALREHGGRCPLKLDWFASRALTCRNPTVIHDLREGRATPLSDHDAIGVDVVPGVE